MAIKMQAYYIRGDSERRSLEESQGVKNVASILGAIMAFFLKSGDKFMPKLVSSPEFPS